MTGYLQALCGNATGAAQVQACGAALAEAADAARATAEADQQAHDAWHLLISGFMVLFMQAGFAMFEVGAVRAKNAKSVMFKNLADFYFAAVIWWLVGFGLAGDGASGADGGDNYASSWNGNGAAFVHSLAFAITSGTIMSGAVLERMTFGSYVTLNLTMVGLVYPLVASWAWGGDGFLAERGFLDFAGSGVVHLTGGSAALAASICVGPRLGRFQEHEADGKVELIEFNAHSPVLSTLGVFILGFGWFSFNASSALGADPESARAAGVASANTLLAPAFGFVTGVVMHRHLYKVHDLPWANNYILGALVAITGPCAYVQSWAACVIGVISAFLTLGVSNFMVGLQIDDPLDTIAVHAANGLLGLVATGLFAERNLVGDDDFGVLLGGGTRVLTANLLGALVIIVWSGGATLALALCLKLTVGVRVDKDTEHLGLDLKYHNNYAYPEFTPHHVQQANEYREAEERARIKGIQRKKRVVAHIRSMSNRMRYGGSSDSGSNFGGSSADDCSIDTIRGQNPALPEGVELP